MPFSVVLSPHAINDIDIFPFTIHFVIADATTVVILRIFNTYQKPIA